MVSCQSSAGAHRPRIRIYYFYGNADWASSCETSNIPRLTPRPKLKVACEWIRTSRDIIYSKRILRWIFFIKALPSMLAMLCQYSCFCLSSTIAAGHIVIDKMNADNAEGCVALTQDYLMQHLFSLTNWLELKDARARSLVSTDWIESLPGALWAICFHKGLLCLRNITRPFFLEKEFFTLLGALLRILLPARRSSDLISVVSHLRGTVLCCQWCT